MLLPLGRGETERCLRVGQPLCAHCRGGNRAGVIPLRGQCRDPMSSFIVGTRQRQPFAGSPQVDQRRTHLTAKLPGGQRKLLACRVCPLPRLGDRRRAFSSGLDQLADRRSSFPWGGVKQRGVVARAQRKHRIGPLGRRALPGLGRLDLPERNPRIRPLVSRCRRQGRQIPADRRGCPVQTDRHEMKQIRIIEAACLQAARGCRRIKRLSLIARAPLQNAEAAERSCHDRIRDPIGAACHPVYISPGADARLTRVGTGCENSSIM